MIRPGFFLVCAMLFCEAASADFKPQNVTAGEMALLPEYCPDTQGFQYGDQHYNTSPRAAYWVGLMGKSFWAHHHYCWALIYINRAKAAGLRPQEREALYRWAINDYRYVVQHSTPDFVLLPEVWTRMGEAYVLLGANGSALEAFGAARRIKPDYWPPYVRWAEVLARLGKRTEALAHLEEGLERMPTERALIEAYERLGGNHARFARSPRAAASAASATP